MKALNIKHFALSAAVSLLLLGCSEDVYEGAYSPSLEKHYLSVSPVDYEFGNGEETKIGHVMSEDDWSFSDLPSWLSLTPTSGSSDAAISLTSAMNFSNSGRTAVFYLSTDIPGWSRKVLTASQAAATPFFRFGDLENTLLYLSGESHTLTVDVETNLEDLALRFDDAKDWLTASYQNNKLTINVGANDDGIQRSGSVELWSLEYSKGGSISITQYEPNLTFNEITSLSFDADGGSRSVDVSSEVPWHAMTNESWIEITPSDGKAGNSKVTITALPSYQSGNRNGQVQFYYKDIQSVRGNISISQSGRIMDVSPNSVILSADDGSSKTVNVNSNIPWKISSCPNWISVSPNKGSAGESVVRITAQKNNSQNSRSGTIIINDSKTGGLESCVTVTQEGVYIGDQTTMNFGWKASQRGLIVPTPKSWEAAVSTDWISLSEYSGEGERQITVSVTRNEGEELRTGAIVFYSENKTYTVNIVQEGQYLNISSTSGEVSAIGGDISLSVYSSFEVKVWLEYQSEVKDWVHYEKTGDETYRIKVDYNPSMNDRTAIFRISSADASTSDTYSQGVKVTIRQFGRKLTADKSRIAMFARGGESEKVFITCEGSYSIEKNPDDFWFILVPDYDNNCFHIVVSPNTSYMERTGYISVVMKDLPQGEEKVLKIEVSQLPETHLGLDSFDDEEDWNY